MVMLWTTKANHALYIGSLPTRARCRENFADAHVSHLFSEAHHVFVDAALRDADAEFEQFAVDARSTPAGILPAHLEDQISDLTSREMTGRPSWSRRTFQVQKKRKPARCQATTVSGLTM